MVIDPKKHKAGQTFKFVCAEAMESAVWQLKRFFPNEEERSKFADTVKQDLENPTYHLYCHMYIILLIPINILDILS